MMNGKAGEHPKIHSNADTGADGRMVAPSAARNIQPILQALAEHVPAEGRALEIASGTGEHAIAFARAFPRVIWQPTDIAPDRLASIEAWRAAERAENLEPAQWLDASVPAWNAGRFDLAVTVNLFHLIPEQAARSVVAGVARALVPGARWFVYGPFRSAGRFRSPGDESFHERLTESDPAIGYKDIEWLIETCADAGLEWDDLISMPANNLALVTRMAGS
jgi:hypothetical protein